MFMYISWWSMTRSLDGSSKCTIKSYSRSFGITSDESTMSAQEQRLAQCKNKLSSSFCIVIPGLVTLASNDGCTRHQYALVIQLGVGCAVHQYQPHEQYQQATNSSTVTHLSLFDLFSFLHFSVSKEQQSRFTCQNVSFFSVVVNPQSILANQELPTEHQACTA